MTRFEDVDIHYRGRLEQLKADLDRIGPMNKKVAAQVVRDWAADNREIRKEHKRTAREAERAHARAAEAIRSGFLRVIPGGEAVADVVEEVGAASTATSPHVKKLRLQAAGLAAVLSVTAGMVGYAKWIHDTRTEMAHMAEETGLSNRTIAGLELATARAGVPLAEIVDDLRDFGEVLFDFERNGGKAEETLSELGIATRTETGDLRALDDVLVEYFDALQRVEDPQLRVAYGQQVMGDRGAKLARILGNIPFEEYIRLADQFGIEMGDAALQTQDKWEKADGALRVAFRSIAMEIGDATLSLIGQDSLADAATNAAAAVVGGMELAKLAVGGFADDVYGVVLALNNAVDDVLDGGPSRVTNVIRYADGTEEVSVQDPQQDLRDALADLTDQTEEWDAAMASAVQKYSDLQKLASSGAISGTMGGLTVLGPEDDDSERQSKLEELRREHQRITDAALEGADAIHARYDRQIELLADLGEATNEWAMVYEAQAATEWEREKELSTFREEQIWSWLETEMAAQEQADKMREEMAKREKSRVRSMRNVRAQLASDLINLGEGVTHAAEQGLNREGKENKKAARAIWGTRLALGLAQVGVSTALGVMKAIEMYGPPPSPLGIAGIAGASLAGATQAALIASQKPSFHIGGTGTSGSPLPDEMDIRVLSNEFGGVLTATGQRSLGGPDAVHAANRGEGAGGTTVIAPIMLSGRVVEMGMVDAMQGTTSEVRSAVRHAARRPGHRRGRSG